MYQLEGTQADRNKRMSELYGVDGEQLMRLLTDDGSESGRFLKSRFDGNDGEVEWEYGIECDRVETGAFYLRVGRKKPGTNIWVDVANFTLQPEDLASWDAYFGD